MQGQSVVIRMKHVISGDESIFKGIITEIGMDGERGVSGTIHYRGCSPTILLESGKTMDSFMDYTLSAIVGEVVKNYGNGVEIVNKPLFNEQIPYVQMHEETGYEFLRRIAYQYGEWFYYDGQKLHFGNPQKDKNETVTYDVELETVSFGSRIAPFHYSRHDYMAEDDRPLYADDSAGVNGINTYLANAIRTSESIYQSPTTLYNKAAVGHPVHMNRLLEFEKGRDTASLVWLRGKSKTCRVRIGEPIAVKIPASMCNRRDLGQYRVMSVIHEVDKNGVYSNTFEGIPASMERIPVSNVVIPQAHPMLAKVISNADPESQGRVKVQFVWQEVSIRPTTGIKPLYTTIATVTMNLIVSAAIVLLNPYVTVYISYKIPPFALSVHIPDVSTSIYVEVDSKVLLGLPFCDKASGRLHHSGTPLGLHRVPYR